MKCDHSEAKPHVLIYKCDCGAHIHRRIEDGKIDEFGGPDQKLREAKRQIRQGLLTADMIIEAGTFTAEQIAELRATERCSHPADMIIEYPCPCSKRQRWRCTVDGCGKIWDYDPRGRSR